MPGYTTSLPEKLIIKLSTFSKELNISKSSLIQKALEIYLRELDKAAFATDFSSLKGNDDLFSIAEEGMSDYLSQLNLWDETN